MTVRAVQWVASMALACLLLAPASGWAGADEVGPWVGRPAPAFDLVDVEGHRLASQELVGRKVVWLNFWGLRCGPCVRELPVLQRIYTEYKDRGLLIVGVNTDGVDGAFIRRSIAKRADLQAAGVTFPLAPDEEFAAIDAFGLTGAPLNVMIDRQGIVRYRHEGYEEGDEAQYLEVLRTLLAQ
ncbi:MAG: hypothetical protein Kow0092_06310 [Deferrisomatales bacterium]